MQIIPDTNILIRFFTNDIPEKASKVRKLLQGGGNLYIPDVVFPELEYVLKSNYNDSREEIIKKFEFLSSLTNITVSPQIKIAVTNYSNTKLDMADCIIAAYALKGSLASFDKELLLVEKVNPYWD